LNLSFLHVNNHVLDYFQLLIDCLNFLLLMYGKGLGFSWIRVSNWLRLRFVYVDRIPLNSLLVVLDCVRKLLIVYLPRICVLVVVVVNRTMLHLIDKITIFLCCLAFQILVIFVMLRLQLYFFKWFWSCVVWQIWLRSTSDHLWFEIFRCHKVFTIFHLNHIF
jgi:hypothetical protein